MTTNFPGGIDTFPRPVATDPLSNPAHAALHTNVSDAVVAIQQNIGTTGETNPATVRGALAGKAPLVHTHDYAPAVHGHAITDVTNLRSELDALQQGINEATVSPLTTKGDLYGFDAIDVRIPVGAPGQVLAADPAAPGGVRWRDEIISPVGGITLSYRFDSALTATPPSGQYRLNNSNPALANQIFVNAVTSPGNDASVIWGGLDIGDYLSLWKTGGGGSQAFKLLTKPVASGVIPSKVYTASIAIIGTPSGTISNNNDVSVNTLTAPAASLPAGGAINSRLTKQSSADYDVFWDSTEYVKRTGDSMAGPLTLASRLLGNFTDAVGVRTFIQTAVANGFSSVGVLPNGTGTTALYGVHNSSDPANSATLQVRANATEVMLNSDIIGAGVIRPLQFRMGNVNRGSLNVDGSWTFIGPTTINADLTIIRPSNPTGGAIFFGDSGGEYLYYDNDEFNYTRSLVPAPTPNEDKDIGTPMRPWRNANFTGSVTVGSVALIPEIAPGRQAVAFGPSRFLEWNSTNETWNFQSAANTQVHVNGFPLVTSNTNQTITGRKIFEAQTDDGSGDLRLTRASDPTVGALFFGTANNSFIWSPPGESFLNVNDELVVSGRARPSSDNNEDLGAASFRWTQLFAAAGAINTSDARQKTELSPLSVEEIAAAKDIAKAIGAYKWLAAVELKDEAARWHIGVTAQRVIEIMSSHGLDAMEYGFVCYDQWGEYKMPAMDGNGAVIPAGDSYGVRYDELMMFIAAGFEARLSALEG